jgi:RNA recognition motif-containing protein
MSEEERPTGVADTTADLAAAQPPSPRGSGPPSYPPNNVLYVGNLYFDVTHADLAREFSNYGDVLNSRVIHDARGLSRG